jgi:putative hydrolase of the HAD superfamily
MRIQAVTFDVGGTLIEPWPSVGRVYADVAARHGVHASPDALNARFKSAWGKRPAFEYTRAAWSELVDDCFAGLAQSPPSRTFFTELYHRFAQPDAWRVFEDVFPTLDALAGRGVRLGILSNWDERLRDLLQRLQLLERFEVVTISCEAGCAKPAPGIFARAATAFGLPPESIAHVGDSRVMDLEGARAAGWGAFLIQRHTARAEVETLNALPDIITRIAFNSAKND